MKYNDIMYNDNYETDYYNGWLIVKDKSINKSYPVKLINNETKRNITRKQFKESVEKYGFDKACNSFKKLYADYRG